MVKEQHAKPGMLGHIHMIIECLSSMHRWNEAEVAEFDEDQWSNVAIVTPKLMSKFRH